ncbi:MAG: hypothetical protein H6R00_3952 [Proteobacteria bacterium]|nr:hypothetical protein [Pseudomonadota bacterium]
MVDAAQVRHSTAKMIFWKWAFGIGVGAACAGAVVGIGQSRAVPPLAPSPSVAELSQPLEATGTASIGGTPLTTASVNLQTAIETPPPTAMMLPLEKPKSAISKIFRVRETTPTGVAHFNTCLPSCETRDPQVVGQEQAGLAPAPVPPVAAVMPPADIGPVPPAPIPPVGPVPPGLIPSVAAEEPVPMPPEKGVVDLAVDGGEHIINRVEGASNAVVHGTKRAFDAAVNLVW